MEGVMSKVQARPTFEYFDQVQVPVEFAQAHHSSSPRGLVIAQDFFQ